MKKIGFILLLTSIGINLFAQDQKDALRYSMLNYGGTARAMGLSNAFGALGADLSAININPGGLAFFTSNKFEFTTGFLYNNSNSNFNGSTVNDGKLNFNISSIGWVHNYNPKGLHWNNAALSLTYTRTNSFNSRYTMEGKNVDGSSLLDFYTNQLNQNGGTDGSTIAYNFPFGANLAYQTYLVNPSDTDSIRYTQVLHGKDGITQSKTVNTRGRMGETDITWAGNYNNKLFIGGAIGFADINYQSGTFYKETPDASDTTNHLNYFTRNDVLNTSGGGINLKFGMIYRLGEYVRLGASIVSPTFYTMHDNWNAQMEADFDNAYYNQASPKGNYDYSLTTPYRATGSMAIFFGTHGLISADYEYTDYTTARLHSHTKWYGGSNGDYSFTAENAAINDDFQAGNNIRVGAEWRLNPIYLRAGFQYQSNPYKNTDDGNLTRTSYSAGIGYKHNDFSLGLAYQLSKYDGNQYINAVSPVEGSVQNSNSYILITLGFRY